MLILCSYSTYCRRQNTEYTHTSLLLRPYESHTRPNCEYVTILQGITILEWKKGVEVKRCLEIHPNALRMFKGAWGLSLVMTREISGISDCSPVDTPGRTQCKGPSPRNWRWRGKTRLIPYLFGLFLAPSGASAWDLGVFRILKEFAPLAEVNK